MKENDKIQGRYIGFVSCVIGVGNPSLVRIRLAGHDERCDLVVPYTRELEKAMWDGRSVVVTVEFAR